MTEAFFLTGQSPAVDKTFKPSASIISRTFGFASRWRRISRTPDPVPAPGPKQTTLLFSERAATVTAAVRSIWPEESSGSAIDV